MYFHALRGLSGSFSPGNKRLRVASAVAGATLAGVTTTFIANAKSAESNVPKFKLGKPRYTQDTFEGRLRTILNQIDPRTLLISDEELDKAQTLLKRFKSNDIKSSENVTDEDLWNAKATVDAIIHAPTGEKMFAPGRMSAFVLMNVPTLIGMLVHGPTSTAAGMFWQFANQSYNVMNNYVNRAGQDVDNMSILRSYAMGVSVACGLVYTSNKALARNPALKRFGILIPYLAVCAAGSCNIAFTRMDEIQHGVKVTTEDGENVGTSVSAGRLAVGQTIVTRGMGLPIVPMLLPPLIMKAAALNPGGAALMLEISVITLCMSCALPAALAILPQRMKLKTDSLEEKFHNLKDKNGNHLEYVYADKGL